MLHIPSWQNHGKGFWSWNMTFKSTQECVQTERWVVKENVHFRPLFLKAPYKENRSPSAALDHGISTEWWEPLAGISWSKRSSVVPQAIWQIWPELGYQSKITITLVERPCPHYPHWIRSILSIIHATEFSGTQTLWLLVIYGRWRSGKNITDVRKKNSN